MTRLRIADADFRPAILGLHKKGVNLISRSGEFVHNWQLALTIAIYIFAYSHIRPPKPWQSSLAVLAIISHGQLTLAWPADLRLHFCICPLAANICLTVVFPLMLFFVTIFQKGQIKKTARIIEALQQ